MQAQPPGPGFPLQAPSVKRRTSTAGKSLDIKRLAIVEQAARLLQQRHSVRKEQASRPLYGLAFTEGDATTIEVIRGNLHLHFVARHNSNEVLPHLPRNVCHHEVTVLQLHAELSVGQRLHHSTFNFNRFFFGHSELLTRGTDFVRVQF